MIIVISYLDLTKFTGVENINIKKIHKNLKIIFSYQRWRGYNYLATNTEIYFNYFLIQNIQNFRNK